MSTVQILVINKRKYAVVPYKEYQLLLDTVGELKDVADIRKRRNEKRAPISQVRKMLLAKSN